MAKSNLAVSTGHIRVLVVYIYIYLLERFTPQSTVLGCLVFTSRATTLLVFPLENTRTYPTPPSFLSFLLPCFPSTIVSYLYRPFQFRETRNWGGIGANHLSIVRLGEIVITRDFREVKSHVGNGWLYDKRNRAI